MNPSKLLHGIHVRFIVTKSDNTVSCLDTVHKCDRCDLQIITSGISTPKVRLIQRGTGTHEEQYAQYFYMYTNLDYTICYSQTDHSYRLSNIGISAKFYNIGYRRVLIADNRL